MNKYKKEYCLKNGLVSINAENVPLSEYIEHLENKLAHTEQLLIHSVGNHVFCPHCGDKRQLKVETDLNSGRVCKSRLCKGK